MDSSNTTVTILDQANKLAALIAKKNEKINNWFDRISVETDILTNESASLEAQYNAVVSVEHLLFKIRVEVEYEHILTKQALAASETAPALRSIFMKRDQYLATVIIKLNSIRDDVATLQKVVYTKSSFNFNK